MHILNHLKSSACFYLYPLKKMFYHLFCYKKAFNLKSRLQKGNPEREESGKCLLPGWYK